MKRLRGRLRAAMARRAARRAVLAAGLVLAWAAFAFAAGLSAASFLIGLIGGLVGGLVNGAIGGGAARLPGRARRPPAERGTLPPDDARAGQPPADPVAPVLAALRMLLAAHRLVLWRIDRAAGKVVATHSTGAMPTPRPAAGEPISWCAEQDQPLRIDEIPGWADARVVAVPVPSAGAPAVLTVEAPASAHPDDALELAPAVLAAGVLAIVLDLRASDRERLADLEHVHRILAFLRDPPRAGEPSAFPDALARTVAEAAASAGALVASWNATDDDAGAAEAAGTVLARFGRNKGPEPGMEIAPADSDLAIAVRAGTTLSRDGRTANRPLAGPWERWSGRPRCTTIIPLLDPMGRCGGVLALWGDEPVDPGVVALLEALGPVLVLQLGHSLDLVRVLDRVDRDGLTGLPNRAALDERLELEARRYHRYRGPVALLLLDLDHFKAVNDTYGHAAGDAVLERVADLLRTNTRDPDIPARYGGEELVVVLPETMLRQAVDVAERIRAAVHDTVFEHDGQTIHLTVSIGVSACPECVEDPSELLRTADEALYQAKRGGRNRVATAPLVAARA